MPPFDVQGARTVRDTAKLKSAAAQSRKWTGRSCTAETPITTRLRSLKVPTSAVERLVCRCREAQVTMTPFLECLIGKVLFEVIEEADTLRCATAISMRRFFPVAAGIDDWVMGLWASGFITNYGCDELCAQDDGESFWKAARKQTQRVRQDILGGKEDVMKSLPNSVTQLKAYAQGMMGQPRANSYTVTNLGVARFPPPDLTRDGAKWRAFDMLFSQSCQPHGSAIQFMVVTLEDGTMSLAVTWQEDVVEEGVVETVVERLQVVLLNAAAGEMHS